MKKRTGRIMTQKVKMGKGRNVFAMPCGFHAYMENWGLAVKNPYDAVSNDDGTSAITDIPPGSYSGTVWHPMVTKELNVTIQPGNTTELNIEIEAPKERLYANEGSDNTRIGMNSYKRHRWCQRWNCKNDGNDRYTMAGNPQWACVRSHE